MHSLPCRVMLYNKYDSIPPPKNIHCFTVITVLKQLRVGLYPSLKRAGIRKNLIQGWYLIQLWYYDTYSAYTRTVYVIIKTGFSLFLNKIFSETTLNSMAFHFGKGTLKFCKYLLSFQSTTLLNYRQNFLYKQFLSL